jgi:hypothetical protein
MTAYQDQPGVEQVSGEVSAATSREGLARFSIRIAPELADKLRNACYWTGQTVNQIADRSLFLEIDRLEQKYGEFKPREAELKRGRKKAKRAKP